MLQELLASDAVRRQLCCAKQRLLYIPRQLGPLDGHAYINFNLRHLRRFNRRHERFLRRKPRDRAHQLFRRGPHVQHLGIPHRQLIETLDVLALVIVVSGQGARCLGKDLKIFLKVHLINADIRDVSVAHPRRERVDPLRAAGRDIDRFRHRLLIHPQAQLQIIGHKLIELRQLVGHHHVGSLLLKHGRCGEFA